ncbi:MAG: G5 domain-containing protein [Chloroflexota bacterium]
MLFSKFNPRSLLFFCLLFLSISGCISPRISQTQKKTTVTLSVDGKIIKVSIPSGSKVQQVLETADITLGTLDKVTPLAYSVVTDDLAIIVTRGREEFETKKITIPFERQTVRNESIAIGETKLLQTGSNGIEELVYRHYYENDQLLGTSVSRSTVLEPAVPEIMMLGVQAPFTPLPIKGKLVYLSGGNAWLMQVSTSKRTPLVTTGDLDGRILRLSNDGKWLLFTRKSSKQSEIEINTLWALNTDDTLAKPIDLKISNIIHFADWDPTSQTANRILFSTVEPRKASPGWQANNDLYRMVISQNGNLGTKEKIIDVNTGGVYGWWGTNYYWSPERNLLAYSRPDGIGLVNFEKKILIPLLKITPLQTHSDWALIPEIAWGADGEIIYTVTHPSPSGLTNPEESPNFDLNALSLENKINIPLVQQSGMFAYPSVSSARQIGKERSYSIAYLQSLTPNQSGTSGYKLIIMDRDGSNKREVFPNPGSPGITPQKIQWAPSAISEDEGDFLAILYQGNIWLIDASTGSAQQVTGDGSIQKIDWQ